VNTRRKAARYFTSTLALAVGGQCSPAPPRATVAVSGPAGAPVTVMVVVPWPDSMVPADTDHW
jgi:hypothetical protein